MWWWMASIAAVAGPSQFHLLDAPLRERRYARVVGTTSARPRSPQSRGPIRAWTLPDGTIEHYERLARGARTELHRFDSTHAPHTSVFFSEGAPDRAVVHGGVDHELPVGAWQARSWIGATLVLPPGAAGHDLLSWSGDSGRFVAQWGPVDTDITSDAFRDSLEAGTGGVTRAAATVWIDGRPGVRYLLDLPHPSAPEAAEVWAIPSDTGVFLASFAAPAPSVPGSLETLATGRAIMSLLEWTQ